MDKRRRLRDDGLAALREDVEGLLRRRHDHVHGAHDHVARQERDGTGDDGATPALEEPDSPSGRWNHPSTWTHSPRRPSVAAPSQSWARNLGMSFAHHGAKGS